MTPQERKDKVKVLREQHEHYFISNELNNAVYIPKMAYRPNGKDELHVSFFPSELEKTEDIYTEFVSINYDSEDPKRTLYLHKFNPHWKEEYELITSNSGFDRHIIPVSELKVVSDINYGVKAIGSINTSNINLIEDFDNLPNPDVTFSHRGVVEALTKIAYHLEVISNKLTRK